MSNIFFVSKLGLIWVKLFAESISRRQKMSLIDKKFVFCFILVSSVVSNVYPDSIAPRGTVSSGSIPFICK